MGRVAQSVGKLPDAESFVASKKGLIALAGLTAFGTLWQFWSLMAASGMAWYFQLAHLPAVIAETIVGCSKVRYVSAISLYGVRQTSSCPHLRQGCEHDVVSISCSSHFKVRAHSRIWILM